MRRTILHISLALLTFTIGFLTSGTYDGLIIALLVALTFFILLKRITSLNLTLHHLKVAVLTLLIWTPLAAFTLHVVMPSRSCVLDLPAEESEPLKETYKQGQPIVTTEPKYEEIDPDYGTHNVTSNTLWVGILDKKAISKPAPNYSLRAKASGIESTVAVAVVIDATTGMVIAAQVLSGHPLLRQSAIEAAYKARFYPTRVCGVLPNVSGILTYRFGL
jgi:hypothetical protein